MLKTSFSRSASGVWKELVKEGDSWKPRAVMRDSQAEHQLGASAKAMDTRVPSLGWGLFGDC